MIRIENISASDPFDAIGATHQPFYRQQGRISFDRRCWKQVAEEPPELWLTYLAHITQCAEQIKCELILSGPSHEHNFLVQRFGSWLAANRPQPHQIVESGFRPETRSFRIVSRLPIYGRLDWFGMQVNNLLIRLDAFMNQVDAESARGFMYADSVFPPSS